VASDIFFFSISMAICIVIIYIIAMLWFSHTHTLRSLSFIGFGAAACLWTLFSGMASIVSNEYFVFIYSVHSVTSAAFPYIFLWFILCFTNSRLAHSKAMQIMLISLPVLDGLLLGTNPWHQLVFTNYSGYPDLIFKSLFWVHAIFAYAAALLGLIVLMRYLYRFPKRTALMIVAALSSLLPYIANILLALDLLGSRRDVTAIGFFITFALFFLSSYNSGLFNFRSIAMTSVFTSLKDAIMIINARGIIIDANNVFHDTFGSAHVICDETPLSMFKSWLAERVKDARPLDRLLTFGDGSNKSGRDEFTMRGNGTDKELTFVLRREYIKRNQISAGCIISMTDVSTYRAMISEIHMQNVHLVELKDLAEQSSKSKGAFLANMSHEIRTPINAITGMAAIARSTDDPVRVANCLDKIDAASRQLLGIINDILDVSKIEANKMELAADPFELRVLVYNVRSIIAIRAEEKHQNLTVAIADDVPNVVIGDDMRLSQILLNLLSNAIKFTQDAGDVSLTINRVHTNGDTHMLEARVTDNGIGITEEQQKRLFRSFEQAEKGTSKRFGGSGLGLIISKSIAILMGGDITLESEPGQGSTFSVRFEVREGTESMLKKAQCPSSYNFEGCTALLVEDIDINREIVMTLLESSGIALDYAENGHSAVEMFNADPERYDIIFMDIHMPVMDGYEATKAIRTSGKPNAEEVMILAMTANAFVEDVARCREVGMNDHIAKPINVELLLEKTARLITERTAKGTK